MVLGTFPSTAWVYLARSRAPIEWQPKAWQLAYRRSVAKWATGVPAYITALTQHPYPSEPLDHSIFESIPSLSIDDQTTAGCEPVASARLLSSVVAREPFRFGLAERIRRELVSVGQAIPPNPIYERVAVHILEHPSNIKDPVTAFSDWFSLVPDVTPSMALRTFPKISRLLYSHMKVPHVQLIMRFAIIAASKGYTKASISRTAINVIVRYTTPSVSMKFMSDLSQHHPSTWVYYHNIAIKAYCLSGRLEDGFALFLEGKERGLRLFISTHRILHHFLTKSNNTACLEVLQAHSAPLGLTPWPLGPIKTPTRKIPRTNSLVDRLRFIKATMLSLNPPSTAVVVNFIADYKATGRTFALDLLFQRAERSVPYGPTNETVLSTWVLAEMVYYYRIHAYRLIIFTFVKYFYPVGVPQDVILYQRLDEQQAVRSRPELELPPEVVSHLQVDRRLFPNHRHTALVWHAMVALNPSGPRLEALYERLVRESLGTPPADPSLPVRPPAQIIDAEHFTPFVRAFSLVPHRTTLSHVFHHMNVLGGKSKPTVVQLTTMLGALASIGWAELVLSILDRIEQPREGSGESWLLPAPELETYVSIIHGLTRSRRARAAREVERRMMARGDYVQGVDESKDRILQEFYVYYQRWQYATKAKPQ